MRRFAVAAALGLALGVPTITFAQAAPPQTPPPQTPPPATQKPAAPPPAAAAAAAPRPSRSPRAPRSRTSTSSGSPPSQPRARPRRGKVSALRDKKLAELKAKNKQLEAAQQKVNQAVLSEEARAQATKEVERLNVEIQRMQQDADAELQELQQQLQLEFQRKLTPVIQQVAQEKGLQMLLSQADAGIVWADPGLDLTAEVIKRFDAATAGAKPPAAPSK